MRETDAGEPSEEAPPEEDSDRTLQSLEASSRTGAAEPLGEADLDLMQNMHSRGKL